MLMVMINDTKKMRIVMESGLSLEYHIYTYAF